MDEGGRTRWYRGEWKKNVDGRGIMGGDGVNGFHGFNGQDGLFDWFLGGLVLN